MAAFLQFQRDTADIHSGDGRPLHGDRASYRSDGVVIKAHQRILFVPSGHLLYPQQTAVQRRAGVHLAKVGRHHLLFLRCILKPQTDRIPPQLFRQLIDRRLHRKNSLRRSVSAVRTGRHDVGVDGIRAEAKAFCPVQRDGFMAGQTDRRRPVFSVRTGVGQRVQVDGPDFSILRSSEADLHLHLMARGRCRLTLFSCKGNHRRHP